MKYEWPEGFDLTGYGGNTEKGAKWMISKGLEYIDAHPKLKSEFLANPDKHDVNESYYGLRRYLLEGVEKEFPNYGPSFHIYDKTLFVIRSMVKYGFKNCIKKSIIARQKDAQ